MKWFDNTKKYYLYRALNKRFVLPVWVLVMLDAGLSIQEIAIIAGVGLIISLILEVPSGLVADTIGHKNALILAMFFQGTSMLFFLGGSFWWIAAASWGYFGLGTLMTGTHQALFYEYLSEIGRKEDYQKLQGRARSFSSGFGMISILFAGIVYVYSPSLTFLIGASLFFIGGIVISTFENVKKKKSVAKEEGALALFGHFNIAWRNIRKEPRLFMLIVTNATITGAAVASAGFQQIIFTNVGLAVSLFGFVYALKRFSSMISAPFLHHTKKYLSPTSVLTIMTVLVVSYFILIGLVTSPIAIIFVVLLATFPFIIADVVIGDFKNQLIPAGSRATTLSMDNLIFDVLQLTIVGIIGFVTVFISIELAHVFIGLILGVVALILLPLTHRAFTRAK